MRSLVWGWLLGLSLFAGFAPLPESCPLSAHEEEEALRHGERPSNRRSRIRKQIATARVASGPAPSPSPVLARRLAPERIHPLALWISRTHQRSPTA